MSMLTLPPCLVPRMVATRVTLDNQGRLVLRDNGKIILPFEHFANAVMLKHMNGPHGLHLGLEATIRAVSTCYLARYFSGAVVYNIHPYHLSWNLFIIMEGVVEGAITK